MVNIPGEGGAAGTHAGTVRTTAPRNASKVVHRYMAC